MNIFTNLIDSIGAPQITWAMIFAILGYLSKTVVDYYFQKRKAVSELQLKAGFETERERESVRVSLLGQILRARRNIRWLSHEFLGHAKHEARIIISTRHETYADPLYENPVAADKRAYMIAETINRTSDLLAEISNFRTYQYIHVQAQFSDVDLVKKIDQLEESLSKSGVYRGYQNELALLSLKEDKKEFLAVAKSKQERESSPLFLKMTTLWAERFIDDFIHAWMRLTDQEPNDGEPTLQDHGIDLSEFIKKESETSIEFTAEFLMVDFTLLQISNESVEFLRSLINVDTELQKLFTKLDKT